MRWHCSNDICKKKYQCQRSHLVTAPPIYADIINAETYTGGNGCDGFIQREYIKHTPRNYEMTESLSAYDDYIGDCLFILKQMNIEPDADTRDKLREIYRYSDGDRFIYRRPEEAVRAYKEAL